MVNVRPQQIEELKDLLNEHHSRHKREHGAMDNCQDSSCVEAKLGLNYLSAKAKPPQDSGSKPFNLR